MLPQVTEPQSSNPEPEADRMCNPQGCEHTRRRRRRRAKTVRTPTTEAMRTQGLHGRTVEEFVLLKAVMEAASCTKHKQLERKKRR
jgi:hypothetical protein